MLDFVGDLKSSWRVLRQRPAHVLAAVATLALGLSASICVFTYVNAFSQSFPGASERHLVRLFGIEEDEPYQDVSFLDYIDYRDATEAELGGLAAEQNGYAASVRHETMTEVAFLSAVSGDYFSVLDVPMSIGRGFTLADDRPGAEQVAVLSHRWWRSSFGADPAVLGRTVYLNYRPHTIVGVANPSFVGSDSGYRPQVWIPFEPFRNRYLSWAALAEDRDRPIVRVYGRLRPGVREEQALAKLATTAGNLDRVYPGRTEPRRLRLEPATWIDPGSRLAETPTVRLMVAAAGGLLLLVCANVANLLLALALGRGRELALRAALGASRARLIRQVVAESVLLSLLAGGLSLLLAAPAAGRLGAYFARPSVWGEHVPRVAELDFRVVVFAFAISVLTGLAAGLMPALWASGRNPLAVLKAGSDGSSGARRGPLRRLGFGSRDVLVTVQVALSIALLVVAGLILRTFATVRSLDPGFSYERLLAIHVSTSSTNVKPEGREAFFRQLTAALAAEPWVRAVTASDAPPLGGHPSAEITIEGQIEPVEQIFSIVLPGFFETLGVEMAAGRRFNAEDSADAAGVAIVNEALARRFFEDAPAVGRRLWWPTEDSPDRSFRIVGVSRDSKSRDFLAAPEPIVYFAKPQLPYRTGSTLLIATRGDPTSTVPDLYQWLRDFEPHLAIVNVIPYSEVVDGLLYTQRMNAELFSALAFLGLLMATVGLFSVMSLTASRRTREIAIRMAVGAKRWDIGRLMLGQALVPVALGVGLGLGASLAMTGMVASLLYGIEPGDPVSLLGGAVLLVASALLAAYVPTRRAATLDPVIALRHD